MPNGSPDFAETELPLLDQFFTPVADCLEQFGREHNLLLTRYWHQEPCWNYMFRHPRGGVGRIMIHKAGDDLLSVQELWWVDRYDEFARYIRRSTPGSLSAIRRSSQRRSAQDWRRYSAGRKGLGTRSRGVTNKSGREPARRRLKA